MKIRFPRSLILRILVVEIAAIAGAALLLPLLMVSVLQRTAATYQDRGLLDQAHTIAAGLRGGPGGAIDVALMPALRPAYSTAYDGRAFIVVDAAAHVIAASAYAARVPWLGVLRRAHPVPFRDAPFIGVSLPVAVAGRPLWVIVSQDETRPGAIVDDVSRAFLSRYLAVLLPILLLIPLVNSLLIRRLVTAVRDVSARAMGIGPRTLHVRLIETGLPTEVAPLVHATNELVARLEDSFNQQAQFIANVVHELRTPLATLRIRLDAVEDPAMRTGIDAQVERLSHVISQLHDLASLERLASSSMARFDLAALTEETIAELAPAVFDQQHAIDLASAGTPVAVVGNRVLIGLALANLITNAVRHTPVGTQITVTVLDEGAVSVEDDGLGITMHRPDQLTRRFWRADHQRSDSAGLGLAIVQRIVDEHGGRLDIGNRAAGGASFTIHLPVAPPRSEGAV